MEWKLRTDVAEGDPEFERRLTALAEETGLAPMTVRVCLRRGLDTNGAIQNFLSPRLDALTDPLRIRDMDRAVDRLAQARAAGEKIRIFGDYDVDGTTGAALLSWIFRDWGFDYEARQPDRFKDGYGLNIGAVEEAAEAGAAVLVTVDCGITSFEPIARANELGIDVIIVDHHQVDPDRGIPEAYAVVDPHRPDCDSGLKELCGCGLAFYLARALRSRGRADGWWAEGSEPNLKQHLDLVVMATAADMVPLTGDNHILVRHGLEVLKQTRKPGVKMLLEVAGLMQREISPGHLGFTIGPRINASGRMGSASLALELLTTTDQARGTELAHELERMNKERADVQNQIWDEVRGRVERGLEEGRFRHGVVVADANWHEGVVGIVASRVTETFKRPAVVIALRNEREADGSKIGKGSVRSFAGKDVLAAVRASSEHLLGFGGHKHAAGLSLLTENVEAFEIAFDQAVAKLTETVGGRALLIEGTCQVADLDVRTLGELERLGPFGPGNPEPVFAFRAAVQNHSILKGRHLKMNLAPVGSVEGRTKTLEAIWFHAAERSEVLDSQGQLSAEEADWAGVPELNRFRGRVTPTLRVRDWRKISRE